MIEQFTSGADGSALNFALIVLGFAALGAGRTVWGAVKRGEKWDSRKARAEIATLSIAGAGAGVYVLYVGASIDSAIFGAAVTVAGHVGREAYEIYTSASARFGELQDKNVDAGTAAIAGLQHGIAENNPAEIGESVRALLALSGTPSQEKAEARARDVESAYREGGLEGAAREIDPEVGGAWREPEEIEEGVIGLDPFGDELEDEQTDVERVDGGP